MEDLADKIVRSKRRRSLALVITKDADFEVRVPYRASLSTIKKFVNENRTWIEKKIEKKKELIDRHRNHVLPKEFIDGEGVMYEGKIYKLRISDCKDVNVSEVLYFPRKFLPQAKQYLIIWLKHRALKKITERVNYFANITGLKHKSVKISSAEGIWGSCNYRGSLIINWRLIMAPSAVLDYIVVHELAHLVVKNHSKLFWNKVKEILPDYKTHETWIKKNGEILML